MPKETQLPSEFDSQSVLWLRRWDSNRDEPKRLVIDLQVAYCDLVRAQEKGSLISDPEFVTELFEKGKINELEYAIINVQLGKNGAVIIPWV